MSKKEARETLRLTFPRKQPYERAEDYSRSKSLLHVQLPSFTNDDPREDPNVQLTGARRIYARTAEALEERKGFYKAERVKLDSQWEELEQVETQLRENFRRMNEFINTNREKRGRAVARRGEDTKLVTERAEQLEMLTGKMRELDTVKADLDKEIANHIVYQKYLNSVAAVAPAEFRNAGDLIDRYESLVATKNLLGLRQSRTFDELEHARNNIAKMAYENALLLLGLNNLLATMNARFQSALRSAMHWERVVWGIKRCALQRFREVTEVKQACRNMFYLMYRRKGETPKIADDDFERQLLYIKKTLQELSNVRFGAERATAKTFSSMQAEDSRTS